MSRRPPNRELYGAIGRMIRAARTDRGMSQLALARELNLFPASVARAESGGQNFTVEALYRYAIALGIEPRSLIP